MPKATITRNGQQFEISDLTFDQVKELVGMNGHAREEAKGRRSGGVLLCTRPTSFLITLDSRKLLRQKQNCS